MTREERELRRIRVRLARGERLRAGQFRRHGPRLQAGAHRLMVAAWQIRQAGKQAFALGEPEMSGAFEVWAELLEEQATRTRALLGPRHERRV
ncbi:MAG: hypothetical protein ACRDRL_03975 [Sciscionella sp.]